MMNLSNQIDQLQQEKVKQEELINEANTAIEDLTEEKHDIAAKMKHLKQVYYQNIHNSENLSSYKGDESSLSITSCFEKIQVLLDN